MKEKILAITTSKQNINVGTIVTVFVDEDGLIKIRRSEQGDEKSLQD